MAAPATPTNIVVQQANRQVSISWDVVAGADSYTVYRSTDFITYVNIAAPAVQQYTDSTVSVGVEYAYKVTASNASFGEGLQSVPYSTIPTPVGVYSLQQLRNEAKQRASREKSKFVTDSEWNRYINQSRFELYDLLVGLFEDYYLAPPYRLQTNGTDQNYPLPDGVLTDLQTSAVAPPYYKLLGVDLGLNNANNAQVTLKRFNFIARNMYLYPQQTSNFIGVFNLKYRVMGNQIAFIPTPSANQIVTLWYIPRLTELLLDTDLADGISGWNEYILVDSCIKALEKEESDTQVFMVQKQELIKRIQEAASNRDAGQADTVSDSRSAAANWGNYSDYFGGPMGGW